MNDLIKLQIKTYIWLYFATKNVAWLRSSIKCDRDLTEQVIHAIIDYRKGGNNERVRTRLRQVENKFRGAA